MKRIFALLLLFHSCAAMAQRAVAQNWPQWRGPQGTGVSRDPRLPIFWSEQRNLKWKCELPRYGTSSPIIWNAAVFVTCQLEDSRLVLLRINKATGKIEWTRVVGRSKLTRGSPMRTGQTFHRWHNMASPTPVCDGRFVAAHFGNGDLAVFKLDGTPVWKKNLQKEQGRYTIWWGYGNSPVIHQNALITVCMQDSVADKGGEAGKSYVIAHDVRDGHVRWRVARQTKAKGEPGDSYTTPLFIGQGDQRQLVVMGANQLDAYDPNNGTQLWYVPQLIGARTITGPTVSNGLIYATIGGRGALLAVQPPQKKEKKGKLPRRSVRWRKRGGTPDTCCPVVWDRLLFTITDDGIARCWNADSGLVKWKRRLPGKYKASPVAVAGRIFFLNTDGLCTVVSARSRYDKLTQNQLDDETIASPAISAGALFIRGRKALYCIARPR